MLNVKETAGRLGITPSGLRKLIAKKEIKYFQHGKKGRILFREAWIDEYIEKWTTSPETATAKKSYTRKIKATTPSGNTLGFNTDLILTG